jgi:hypothetical protein
MSAGAETEQGASAVPLLHAVFCVDCETISNSPHDACMVCGSHSLISLFRMLGGTLRSQTATSNANTARYNLELTAKVYGIPYTELNQVIESVTLMARACAGLESLHINVESVFDTGGALKAA